VSNRVKRRARWIIALAGALAVAIAIARRKAAQGTPPDAPADVAFMLALHSALRRDLSRLEDVANRADGMQVPLTVLAGWDAFRRELDNHHSAEDDDLWPILRPHLSEPTDLAVLDAMVQEHEQIPEALDAVDAALRGDGDLREPAQRLSTVVRNHLEHEEREALPLVESHLTRAQWRRFLLTVRGRRTLRERPQFLTWILDDASNQDAAAVLSELPPPARVVYQRILKPRYDARHHWQFQPTSLGSPG